MKNIESVMYVPRYVIAGLNLALYFSMVKLKEEKFLQSLRYFKRTFAAVYGATSPDPDCVHDLRVYSRRLLAILYLLKAKEYGKEHLNNILDQTGPMRDQYIYEKNVAALDKSFVRKENLPWKPSESTFKAHKEAVKHLNEAIDLKERPVEKRFLKTTNDIINRLGQLGQRPKLNYLHEIRIKIKRLRYIHDVVESENGRRIKIIHKLCRDAQTELGDLHDCQNILARYKKSESPKKEVIKAFTARKNKLYKSSIIALKRLLRALKD